MVEKAAPIGQEGGPGMLNLLPIWVNPGDRRRRTTRVGHAKQAAAGRSEEDHTIVVPRALAKSSGVLTQGLWRAAGGVHFLQPSRKSVDAEGQKPTIRRPEWAGDGAFGSR